LDFTWLLLLPDRSAELDREVVIGEEPLVVGGV
jgi:hypothetical protein